MEAITIKPRTKRDLQFIKTIVDSMKIPYNTHLENGNGTSYSKKFSDKINEGLAEKKAGKGKSISMKEFKALWK